MIDLHCHSNHSDGTWSVSELLEKANEKHITTLAITDHDTVNAHYEIAENHLDETYPGTIIVGAEFNCVYQNTKIELLGYGFSLENVSKWLDRHYGPIAYRASMTKEFEDMKRICAEHDVILSPDLEYHPEKEYPIDVIYYDMIRHEENKEKIEEEVWNNRSLFFRKCTTDKNFLLYRDFTQSYPSAKEVSDLIRENGGKVFLAHLFVYNLEEPFVFLDSLVKDHIIDGVECYYSKFDEKQIKEIEDYCLEHHLYRSGGSDCHGEKHPDIALGVGRGSLQIPENAIFEWLN